jgi:TRAP-type mannitol/chloroaromatic compound transport system permease small subunit
MSERARALVNVAGVLLFLWPMLGVITWASYRPILRSWQVLERSPSDGGLPFVFLHKTLIFVFCALLFLQGFAMLLRAARVLYPPRCKSGD